MTRRKHRSKWVAKQISSTLTDPCAQRLSNLALELTLAGGQVLREDFGFTEEQVNEWLDKTVSRAQTNRNAQ